MLPPCNEEHIVLLDSAGASEDDRRLAEEAVEARGRGWADGIRALIRLSQAPPMVAWLLGDARPGLAWQALQPDSRQLLVLLARTSTADLEALLARGVPLEIDDPTLGKVRIDRLRAYQPLPTWVLQASADGLGTSSYFGYAEGFIARANGATFRAWLHAGPRFATWSATAQGPVVLHPSPAISVDDRDALAEAMEAHVGALHAAFGLEADAEPPIDVFLYADEREGSTFGHTALAFALPDVRQVHQSLHHTRGHEITHVVLRGHWGEPGTTLADEGCASWANGGDIDVRARASRQHLRVDAEALHAWADDFDGTTGAYDGAALLCGWALETGGPDAVRGVWSSSKPLAELQQIAGVPDDEGLATVVRTWAFGHGTSP